MHSKVNFLSRDIYDFQDSRGRRIPFLIAHYHFQLPHEHLYISQENTEESSSLYCSAAG